MDVAGDYLFDAPQELVWASLLDPAVLGAIMPGGKGIEQTGDGQYKGVLEVKVGPVQGTFQGQITLSDLVAPEHYHIAVDGKGAPGFVKAIGGLHLEARGQQTFMTYSGTAQVGGRIASVGQRLIDSAARSIIRQSLDALNEYLKVVAAKLPLPTPEAAEAVTEAVLPPAAAVPEPELVAAPSTSAAPAPTYAPPSQMALGVRVARDVLSDIIAPQYQLPLLAGTALFVLVMIVMLLAGR